MATKSIFKKVITRPAACFGAAWVLLCVVVAIFGPYFIVDKSADADQQLPAFALQAPGFSGKVVYLPKTNNSGGKDNYRRLPIANYSIKNDSVIFQTVVGAIKDSFVLGRPLQLHQVEAAFSIHPWQPEITNTGNGFTYKDANNNKIAVTKAETLAQIADRAAHQVRFRLGSDLYGRDVLSRLVRGARVSLIVGFVAVLFSLLLGIIIGLIAGYFGGWIDNLLMLLINTLWSLPTILLCFALVLAFGRQPFILYLAIGLSIWVEVARLVRGQTIALKEGVFIKAAVALGLPNWRILFLHIFPNLVGPVLVMAGSNFATAILIESGLSFLGFGIRPPQPSWGNILNENYGYALAGQYLPALLPAMAILFLVLAFNLLSNGLRDALDPKQNSH